MLTIKGTSFHHKRIPLADLTLILPSTQVGCLANKYPHIRNHLHNNKKDSECFFYTAIFQAH